LYSNLFEKFNKNEMKNWNPHYYLSNTNFFYQKDKCSIQGGFSKGWYIQCHNLNYPNFFYHYEFVSFNGVGN
jgi:hypothetical protein